MNLYQKQFNSIAAVMIIIAAIIFYSNTFKVPFQFDDIYHITQKTTIRDLGNYGKISEWKNVNERPLPMFTLALNYRWGGVNPVGYHVFNLIFHILAGWAVYLLTVLILSLKNLNINQRIADNKLYFGLLAALIFIAHPLQTQAVTYIIQRITVISTLFYILGIYYYLLGRSAHVETGDPKGSIKQYALTLLFFILSMLSKQIAVTFPLALLLVEFFFIRDTDGKIMKKYLLTFASIVGGLILIGLVAYGIPRESQEIPRNVYLFTSFKVLVRYLFMFIIPVGQNIDHYVNPASTLFAWQALGSLAILVGLIYLAYRMYRQNPLISFGIAWFFITLLVEQSVIPIKDFMFEHRLYLPSFGLIISALAALFTYLPMMDFRKSKIPVAIALSGVLIIIYGFATHARNTVWKSDLSLWTDAVKKSPEKGRPYLWQGIAFSNLNQLPEAKKCLDKSIELIPTFPMGYYNRGNVYKEMGNFREALADYDKAIEIDPDYMLAYFNRGVVKGKLGRYPSAIEDYNVTLKSDPQNVNTFYNRGNAYRNIRKFKEAIEDYDKAIEINPKYTLAIFNRGLSKAGLGDHQAAIEDFDLALRQDQKNHLFYNGKGVSLYALQRFPEAIANYDAAIRVNPNFGQAYYNRAYAKYFGLNDMQGGCGDWQMAANLKYRDATAMLKKYCGVSVPGQPTNNTANQARQKQQKK